MTETFTNLRDAPLGATGVSQVARGPVATAAGRPRVPRRLRFSALVAAFVFGGALLVACDGGEPSIPEAETSEPVPSTEVDPTVASTLPSDDSDDVAEQPGQDDVERVDAIDDCLLGLWQADNASWSAVLGGLSVTGEDLWLLLANGLSMQKLEGFQIAGGLTLDMLSEGSWAAKDGLIRWDSYDLYVDGTFEIRGAVRAEFDLTDKSAVKANVSTAAGVRTEGITDISGVDDDPESENGPWTVPYACQGDRLELNRGGQTLVYNLIDRW